MKCTIGNVCFVFDEQDRVLLLHRAKEPMKNISTGVGGKTEFHEDIHASCEREVFEETGLRVTNTRLKGVVKTISETMDSSWILFVYTAHTSDTTFHECPEGVLEWVPIQEVYSYNLVEFIRRILPYVFQDGVLFEGTIVHDHHGHVISDRIECQ